MLIVDLLKSTLSEQPVLSEEKVQSIIHELFDKLPQFMKRSFLGGEDIKVKVA
jgi:hypothetical protein